jgi:hypothetical protein
VADGVKPATVGAGSSPFCFYATIALKSGPNEQERINMHWMETFAAVGIISLAGAVAGSQAGQAQTFQISQNGKSVGTANLLLSKAAAGFDMTSAANVNMPGLVYKFTENESLDGGYHLTKVQLNGTVNGKSATVNTSKLGAQFLMKINADGNVTTTPLVMHPNAVFLPDFDPGALQLMLNLGAAHNNSNMWALVPKQTGSITAMRVVTNADMQGTLAGKPLAVHHLTVACDTSKIEVFSSPANELLQAEWRDEGFALVRQGFKLTPPAKPGAPPPPPPPQPAQPQGQAPQPQQQ